MVLLKIAGHCLLSCYRTARKINRTYRRLLHRSSSSRSSQQQSSSSSACSSLCPDITKFSVDETGKSFDSSVCDIQGTLLRSPSFFPYFMLVAFEGGSIIRALLLLLTWPLVLAFGDYSETSFRIMAFVAFCGMKTRDVNTVAKAVLPKFYLENLNKNAYEMLAAVQGKKAVITSVPRLMVEEFLKEYLGVERVVGAELQVVGGCFFSGILSAPVGFTEKNKAMQEIFGEGKPELGLVNPFSPHDHLFISHCKETYVVMNKAGAEAVLPREKYPKPLIFHDGRLAFFPTPLATLSMFMYLPLGIILAFIRITLGIVVPYKPATAIGHFCGFRLKVSGSTIRNAASTIYKSHNKGVLFVCSHRTLLDPVLLSTALRRPVTAVTYSLSRMSEILAPMKTVRLTRDRIRDAETMSKLLKEGDLAVCPEGTTCREPYLLRFSPLFAELADDIEPVAIDVMNTSLFYGTTASGFKWLDPFFFLMNPWPEYVVQLLGRVPYELTCSGGCPAIDVANRIQGQLASALGFEPTKLTRKDKYLMLAGNEGTVKQRQQVI